MRNIRFKQFLFLLLPFILKAQIISNLPGTYTLVDSLLGSNTEFRKGWDVKHYDLTIEPDFKTHSIKGINKIKFVNNSSEVIQIDLQPPMKIDSIYTLGNIPVPFIKKGGFYYLDIKKVIGKITKNNEIIIYFSGKPIIAKNAPWEGGWIFTRDNMGNDWMTVVCEGIGASFWFPCKDYLGDEPEEGALLTIITDENLKGIGNGKLVEYREESGKRYYKWQVINPINNYNIIPYIGNYVNFTDYYKGEKGNLELSYWVMPYNLNKAENHFLQVKDMLKAFEYWFGPYPFYEDGYKLIESPYLGMEHQSAIAYGNQYKNGYLAYDRSGTGTGLKWDFIIIHESGHEWFGNNITNVDVADMWIHEAFTTYSETLFIEYYYGKQMANKYIVGQRQNIKNDIPIIGVYNVHKKGSSDMYDKGANIIHTIRQIIDNDNKFRSILIGLNKDFYHKTVTSQQIENYVSEKSGINFSNIFNQYLRTIKIPELNYYINNNKLYYRWTNVIPGFTMEIRTSLGKIKPTEKWKTKKISYKDKVFTVDENYYIRVINKK